MKKSLPKKDRLCKQCQNRFARVRLDHVFCCRKCRVKFHCHTLKSLESHKVWLENNRELHGKITKNWKTKNCDSYLEQQRIYSRLRRAKSKNLLTNKNS